MSPKLSKSLFALCLLGSASAALAFLSQTFLVTPANAGNYGFQIEFAIEESLLDPGVEFHISAGEHKLAELGDCVVYQTKEPIPSERLSQMLAGPFADMPEGEVQRTFEVPRRLETLNGVTRWSSMVRVPESEARRTYLKVPPPKNVEDGTTYWVELPGFLSSK